MKTENQTRGKLFVNRKYQIKLILHFEFLVLLSNIISFFMLYYLTLKEIDSAFLGTHGSVWIVIKQWIIFSQLYVFIIMTILTIFLVLFSSHRVVGPLKRLERIANEVSEGKLMQSLTVRKKDELSHFISCFQIMLEKLRNTINELNENFNELKNINHKLLTTIKHPGIHDNDKDTLIKKQEELLNKFEKNLNTFTLS